MSYDAWRTRVLDSEDEPDVEDIDTECPHCHDIEHQEDCPLYQPFCACGKHAKRHVDGEPLCGSCCLKRQDAEQQDEQARLEDERDAVLVR